MNSPSPRQYSPADFLYGRKLGEGRFGTVVYAELKNLSTDQHHDASSHLQRHAQNRSHGYAVKMIPKSEILRHNQMQAVMTEKHILTEILSSNEEDNANALPASELFMKLFLCFHDANCLYLVLELCAGGTLLDLIQSRDIDSMDTPVMDISWIRYFAGQILRAIEYLHQHGVIHRDISPQNIGLTFPKGEIKLGDYGSAAVFVKKECEGTVVLKRWLPSGTSSTTVSEAGDFVGTADYVSPEMIRGSNEDTTKYPGMDIWAFGCIIYHMFVGKSPFEAASDHLAFRRVLDYANGKKELSLPQFLNEDVREFISSLLSVDSSSRLGMQNDVFGSSICCNSTSSQGVQTRRANQYKCIRKHPFFQIDKDTSFWTLLENKSIEPPYSPAQPKWMAELDQRDAPLMELETIQFDL